MIYSLPCDQAAVELSQIYQKFSENVAAQQSRESVSNSDKVSSVADAIGSLGMILSAIKKPSGDQNTLSFSIKNDSEHVIVPYRTRCNGDFYATANLDIITPKQNSNVDFNINAAFDGNVDVYLDFAVCGQNELSTPCSIHITKTDHGEICPYSITANGEHANFDRSEQSDSASHTSLTYAAYVGDNNEPSFGVSVVGSVLNAHAVGITITPWLQV